MPRPAATRYASLDAVRGAALLWMTAFHFCFDLQTFGWLHQNFHTDAWWTVQRALIVTLFVFCAGFAQALAHAQAVPWTRFWRRWRQLVAGALLVSLGSYLVFPQSFIYFGILHGLALMTLLARASARWRAGLWAGAALALLLWLAAPSLHRAWPALQAFNTPWLNWLGLIDTKPVTEDYAPLLPWVAALWCGLASGQLLLRRAPEVLQRSARWVQRQRSTRALAWLGRHSLGYYLLHQPLMLAVLGLVALARG